MRPLAVMMILVFLETVLTFFFVVGILTGRWNDIFLGTILGTQFMVLAMAMICYILVVVPPREVSEDRDKGLLW